MKMHETSAGQQIKACCAATYGSDWARLLIGDSMHPGGVELTERLGNLLEINSGSRVLDIASGRGKSALALARKFGCEVTGIELSPGCIEAARGEATHSGLTGRVRFEIGDAEALLFAGDEFDAVICECAFCTFPDKVQAAGEMARVLKPGGRLGLSDLVRRGELPTELQTLAGWVACVADARPESDYIQFLGSAGFRQPYVEIHDDALASLVEQVRGRLLGATVLATLGKLEFGGADLRQATGIAKAVESAVRSGMLGYVLLTAIKPAVHAFRDRDQIPNDGGDAA
jgi:arsenite methyltransferase